MDLGAGSWTVTPSWASLQVVGGTQGTAKHEDTTHVHHGRSWSSRVQCSSTQNASLHPWVHGRRPVMGKLRLAVEQSLLLRQRGPSWLEQSSGEAAAHRAAVSSDK